MGGGGVELGSEEGVKVMKRLCYMGGEGETKGRGEKVT